MNRRSFLKATAAAVVAPKLEDFVVVCDLPIVHLNPVPVGPIQDLTIQALHDLVTKLCQAMAIPKHFFEDYTPSSATSARLSLDVNRRRLDDRVDREFRLTSRVPGQPTDSSLTSLATLRRSPHNMFEPSIFPDDKFDELQLCYDGNPESVAQKIFFHPPTRALVYSFVDDLNNGRRILADTGMTFEDVIQDFTIAGQGMSHLQTMWQFATLETAQQVVSIIKGEIKLPFDVTTEIKNDDPNVAFPTNKPMRSIYVTRTETGKVARLNAGLEAQAFGATLSVDRQTGGGVPPNSYVAKYSPNQKLEMLQNSLLESLQ